MILPFPIRVCLIPSPNGLKVPMPQYATEGAAAFDLRACLDSPVTIPPGGKALIPSGLSFELPSPETVLLIFARSGLAIRAGVSLSNGVGVIDSDYRGEVAVGIVNNSLEPFTVSPLDRIAQAALMPVLPAVFKCVDDLSPSNRGCGGFGSTGLE